MSTSADSSSSYEPQLRDSDGFRSISVEWDRFIAAIELSEFELLLRSIELVVLAQAFSRIGLARAFRISMESADRITRTLEALGVIGVGGADDPREVYMTGGRLPNLFAELRSRRSDVGQIAA